MLSNLPVDVTIGKMLIMGTLFHQIESVLSLAAALSVQSPFTNKAYQDSDCVAARKNLDSDHGDPVTLLNSYRYIHAPYVRKNLLLIQIFGKSYAG